MPKILYILLAVHLGWNCSEGNSNSPLAAPAEVSASDAVSTLTADSAKPIAGAPETVPATETALLAQPPSSSEPVSMKGASAGTNSPVKSQPGDKLSPSPAVSKTVQPGNVQPGTSQPGNVQPGTSQPDNVQPGNVQPGTSQPAISLPGTSQPGNVQPGTSQPASSGDPALTGLLDDMDKFFRQQVRDGGINYAALSAAPQELQKLVQNIAQVSVQGSSPQELKAFRINAYNLLAIQQVLNHYPIASPLDVPGFFKDADFRVAGQQTSLDGLESPLRSDPRTHFALVCAARGCPPLKPRAYLPQTVDAQLDEATRSAINDPQWLRYDQAAGQVSLSLILQWYAADFGGEKALVAYVNRYRKTVLPADVQVDFYPYDWRLNQVGATGP
jgi:hypothetical protein